MSPTTRKRILKTAGYVAFCGVCFLLMLYATFPCRSLADAAEAAAREKGFELSIGAIGPSFLWIKASRIALTPPKQPGGSEPQPIPIDEIKVRPALFPPGVSYEAKVFGGTIEGHYGVLGKSLVARARGLDLSRTNSKASVGVDLAGKLDATINLALDPDGTKMTGKIGLNGEGLALNGGTVSHFDLPKADLGRLEVALKLAGGKAAVEVCKIEGADVESSLEGEVQLAQKVMLSALKLKLKFKPGEDFLKRNSFIQAGLNLGMRKDSKGFYTVDISHMLVSPEYRPQR